MKVLITGGTGFIGSALCNELMKDKNNEITILSRNADITSTQLKIINNLNEIKNDASFDIIINLAGEPIADKKWSKEQKQKIITSRIETTEEIIEFIKNSVIKPKLLISGSAIGYYGIHKSDAEHDENSASDDSFSSKLCQQWEATALQANDYGVRTCLLRTGIVLGKNSGALGKMLMPFKMGLGGKIGSGEQWMSWIHISDLVGIILHCIEHDSIEGPVNGTAPNPSTNNEFTKALGKALKRPTFIPMPKIVINILMGQMGVELLLSGKKILPIKALENSYQFKYPTLDSALNNVIQA